MAGIDTEADALTALVVDDEAPALAEMRFLLEQDARIGQILVASSGTDALRALESQRVDVVFSDINMPGLDGMELARVIARFAQRPRSSSSPHTTSTPWMRSPSRRPTT